jgi:hypothetical protein
MEHFPSAVSFPSSDHYQILRRLSALAQDSSRFDEESTRGLPSFKGVELHSTVLQNLSSMSFDEKLGSLKMQLEASGRKSRKNSRANRSNSISFNRALKDHDANSQAFKELGVDVPFSSQEADVLASALLVRLRSNLEVRYNYFFWFISSLVAETQTQQCLAFLRGDNVVRTVRQLYFGHYMGPEGNSNIAEPLVSENNQASTSLYFSNPKSLGPWRIYFVHRAENYLRDIRKRDQKTLNIVLKKVK